MTADIIEQDRVIGSLVLDFKLEPGVDQSELVQKFIRRKLTIKTENPEVFINTGGMVALVLTILRREHAAEKSRE